MTKPQEINCSVSLNEYSMTVNKYSMTLNNRSMTLNKFIQRQIRFFN